MIGKSFVAGEQAKRRERFFYRFLIPLGITLITLLAEGKGKQGGQ